MIRTNTRLWPIPECSLIPYIAWEPCGNVLIVPGISQTSGFAKEGVIACEKPNILIAKCMKNWINCLHFCSLARHLFIQVTAEICKHIAAIKSWNMSAPIMLVMIAQLHWKMQNWKLNYSMCGRSRFAPGSLQTLTDVFKTQFQQ